MSSRKLEGNGKKRHTVISANGDQFFPFPILVVAMDDDLVEVDRGEMNRRLCKR